MIVATALLVFAFVLACSAANAEIRMICNPHVKSNPCYSFPAENIDPVVNAQVNRLQKENEILDALRDRLRRPIVILRRWR
jgi:hypothetical protein